MTSRRPRISQVRPRPPSTGRSTPKPPTPRPLAPGRIAPHRKIERGPGLPLGARVLLVLGVLALGAVILLAGVGMAAGVAANIGRAFADAISHITTTATPSPSVELPPNAPTLSRPDQPYTNQATIDLTGTIPAAFVGDSTVKIRIYRTVPNGSPAKIAEIPTGSTATFTVPQVALAKGQNDFTARLLGAGGEGDPSTVVTYILDTTKPKITITKPAKNAVVNGKTATLVGKTQAGSSLVARNQDNSASVTGTAADDGSFSLALAIGQGSNTITITATDPAGNQATASLTVVRGTGQLAAEVRASSYSFSRKNLPDAITMTVIVHDPDGHLVSGATVQFSLAPPGVAAITQTLTTGADGKAVWKTTIPKGATAGSGTISVLVNAGSLGTTNAQHGITIS